MPSISDFQFNIRQDTVFKAIECRKNSPIYQEILKGFTELTQELAACIRPVGGYCGAGTTCEGAAEHDCGQCNRTKCPLCRERSGV